MTCLACGIEIPPERRAAMPLTDIDVPEAMAVVEIDLSEMYGR